MKFIKFIENPDGFTMDSSDYPRYVNEVRDKLPEAALEFMAADWHYDHRDSRCPHDARVEYAIINDGQDKIDVEILLNRVTEGKLRLIYSDVQCYSFEKRGSNWPVGVSSHGDWMIDEMLLGGDGFLTHEIIFMDALWKMSFKNFNYSFE